MKKYQIELSKAQVELLERVVGFAAVIKQQQGEPGNAMAAMDLALFIAQQTGVVIDSLKVEDD